MMSLRRFIWPIASLSKPYLTNTYSVPKTFNSFATFTHNPVKSKFPKQHRGTIKGISSQGNHISFGKYALQALEPAWITSRQIEAGRKTIIRNARPGGKMGKIWVRIFPDKSITLKPGEVRMGRGKGSPAYCVAVVKPGRILYEIDGVTESIARKAISVASTKIPVRTKFIVSG